MIEGSLVYDAATAQFGAASGTYEPSQAARTAAQTTGLTLSSLYSASGVETPIVGTSVYVGTFTAVDTLQFEFVDILGARSGETAFVAGQVGAAICRVFSGVPGSCDQALRVGFRDVAFTPEASPPPAVPLPATAPLLAGGLGLLLWNRRRTRS